MNDFWEKTAKEYREKQKTVGMQPIAIPASIEPEIKKEEIFIREFSPVCPTIQKTS